MKYLGSKKRIVREILPIMLSDMKEGQTFVDAFCGSCSIIERVPKTFRRLANDKNQYLIAMWEALVNGKVQLPKTIERDFYNDVKLSYKTEDNRYSDEIKGWVGFMASFNGRFFDGGYSGHNATDGRDYIAEQIKSTEAQIPLLYGVEWQKVSYECIEMPDDALIYCDIPYKGTTQYTTSRHFDYEHFYEWCRAMSASGHKVYVSEYSMPENYTCIWEKTITNSMSTTKTYKSTERLYTLTS